MGAIDSSNEESLTEIIEATTRTTPKVPDQPSVVSVVPKSSIQINITWNPVSDAKSYNIYRASDKNGPFTKINSFPVKSAFYSSEGLLGDTTYYYKISAVNYVGEKMSDVVSAKTFVHLDDHGDNLLTATPILEDSSNQSVIGGEGDHDYFTFTPSFNTNIWFLGTHNYPLQIEAYTYDSNGQVSDDFNSGEGKFVFSKSFKKGETYYLKVSARYGYTGYYTIKTLTEGFRPYPVTSSQIKLEWNVVPAATSYNVYRSDNQNGPYYKVNDTPITTNYFPDFGLSENTTYYYKVGAINQNGENFIDRVTSTSYSGPVLPSEYHSATTFRYFDDHNDTLDSASVMIGGVDGGDIGRAGDIDYLTYTATKPGEHHVEIDGEGIKVSLINSLGIELANNDVTQNLISYSLSEGSVYYLKVQHEKEIGSGRYLIKITNQLETPGNILVSAMSSDRVEIYWGGYAYNLYRATSKEGDYIKVNKTPLQSNSFEDAGLSANTTYYYKISRINSFGESLTDEVAVTTKPNPPNNVTASPLSSSEIKITWTAIPGAIAYNIYRSTKNGEDFYVKKINSITAPATTFIHTGLTANTKYSYKVRAVNSGGESSSSNPVTATTRTSAPESLSASSISSSQINLKWNSVPGAASHNIYRTVNNEVGPYTKINTTPVTASTFSNTGLTANTKYYYKVTAVNAGGESALSTAVMATTRTSAPKSLTASSFSSSRINLKWNLVPGATSYNIYRTVNNEAGPYTKISIIPGTASTYSQTELSANTKYYYKVKAVNASARVLFPPWSRLCS